MAQWANKEALDAGLEIIAKRSSRLLICTSQPGTYDDAEKSRLGAIDLTPDDLRGPKAGKGDSRRITVKAAAVVRIDRKGTATHIALTDSKQRRLVFVDTCRPAQLFRNDRVRVKPWDIEAGMEVQT